MDHNAGNHIDQSVKRPKSQNGYRILKQRVVLEAGIEYINLILQIFLRNVLSAIQKYI